MRFVRELAVKSIGTSVTLRGGASEAQRHCTSGFALALKARLQSRPFFFAVDTKNLFAGN